MNSFLKMTTFQFSKGFTLLLIAFLFTWGCQSAHDVNLFTQTGTYSLQGTEDLLCVSTEDSMIVFKLEKAGQSQTFNEGASSHSRWSAYWDEAQQRIWFNSSDIGLFLYQRQSDGNYSRAQVASNSSIGKEMPAVFFDTLPSSVTRNLARPNR